MENMVFDLAFLNELDYSIKRIVTDFSTREATVLGLRSISSNIARRILPYSGKYRAKNLTFIIRFEIIKRSAVLLTERFYRHISDYFFKSITTELVRGLIDTPFQIYVLSPTSSGVTDKYSPSTPQIRI